MPFKTKRNNDKCQSECEKPIKYFYDYAWNPSLCTCECDEDCEIGGYLKNCTCTKNLADDLLVTCKEILDIAETTSVESVGRKILLSSLCYFLSNHSLVLLILITIVSYYY